MMTLNLTALIAAKLREEKRNTGMLHCSTHLTAPIRHTQLYKAGVPSADDSLASSIRMHTGTLWHAWFDDMLRSSGNMVLAETDLTAYLPSGWTGRADYLIWNSHLDCFELYDLKTTKGESMPFIEYGGVKEEHMWQVSAYLMAAETAGIPVRTDRAYVYYLPMTEPQGKSVEPILADFTPYTPYKVGERIEMVESHLYPGAPLVPWPEPEARLYKDSKNKRFNVSLMPHWSSKYCPYGEACGCSFQRPQKIGHWALDKGKPVWYGDDEPPIKVPEERWSELR
jgi:hypothetical protein